MANAQNFTVSFIIRTQRIKEGKAPVFARFSINGRRTEFSVKRVVDPELWNKEAGKVKLKSKEAPQINTYLDKIRRRLMDCYEEALLAGKLINGQTIKNAYFGINDQQTKTTDDLFDYHNTTCQTKLSPKTYQLYLITQNLWREFLTKKTRNNTIAVKVIDYSLLVDFELFLRKRDGRFIDTKLCNNTAMKHQARIRKMLNLADRIGWISSTPFKSYKLKYDKFDRGFLDHDQLTKLEDFQLPSTRLQTVADLFIFCCYSGVAYIDMQNLTKDNLIKGIDGQNWLSFHRHKTNISAKLPLLSRAQTIIDKYTDYLLTPNIAAGYSLKQEVWLVLNLHPAHNIQVSLTLTLWLHIHALCHRLPDISLCKDEPLLVVIDHEPTWSSVSLQPSAG